MSGMFFGPTQGTRMRMTFVSETPERLKAAVNIVSAFAYRDKKERMYSAKEREKVPWLSTRFGLFGGYVPLIGPPS